MTQNRNRTIALLAGCLLILPMMACDDSEVIPPDGSTLTITANPATVVLNIQNCAGVLADDLCGTTEVITTVRNELGVPLPGQDVRFSTNAGQLFKGSFDNAAANLPIPTDSFGNATIGLITPATTTVTATAGNAAESLTLQTATGNISRIQLELANAPEDLPYRTCATDSSTEITSCSQEICLRAKVTDTGGAPLDNIAILFSLINNTFPDGNTFTGTFQPSNPDTGSQGGSGGEAPNPGVAYTKFVVFNDDCTPCRTEPCQGEFLAETTGGVQSFSLPLTFSLN